MSVALAEVAAHAARRVKARKEAAERPPEAITAPPILDWAREHVKILHPVRGYIPFEPYDYQAEFLTDPHPRRLVLKARQIGFSLAVAVEALYYAIHFPNQRILFISKSQDDAANILSYVYEIYDHLQGGPELVRRNTGRAEFDNGSQIRSLPANPSAGRGWTANRVYLDEFAFALYAREIYTSVAPTLSRGGVLSVLSTPLEQAGMFFELWTGMTGGDWSRREYDWRCCPEYDQAWYERERPNYTAAEWGSEYECDFRAAGEAVFDRETLELCAVGWHGLAAPRVGGLYVTAWDIGRRRDATVGITLDIAPHYHPDGRIKSDNWQLVAYERFVGLPYPKIQAAIEQRHYLYGGDLWVESNGPGDPVIENLQVAAEPYFTSAKTKYNAISSLVLAVENQVLKHGIEQLHREMLVYQWNDDNLVQDSVIAAAIACWAAEHAMPFEEIVSDDDVVQIGADI